MKVFPADLWGKRTRRELERQLRSIIDRLEHLESAPTSRSTELAIEKHVAIQLDGIITRLDVLDVQLTAVFSAADSLEKHVQDLMLAIDQGILRVDRSERRVSATIQKARKQLAEHGFESPGLEAEATELRLVDGEGSTDGQVPAVPERVGPTGETPSSIKGVTAETLRRVRGF